MIYFIHGEDSYRVSAHLSQLRRAFEKESGGRLAVARIDGEKATLQAITDVLRTPSLLTPKQLVICVDVMRLQKSKLVQADIAEWLASVPVPTHATLVFVEYGAVVKTNPIRKALENKKSAQKVEAVEFTPLVARQLDSWASKQIAEAGSRIEPSALQLLVGLVGQDLWKLSHEIEKLLAFTMERKLITADDVNELVHAQVTVNIFDFVDALGQKQMRRALELLHHHLDAGEDPLYLLSMMVYQFRNLIKVKSLMQEGKSAAQIASVANMHPFVVGKTSAQAQKFSLPALMAIHSKLYDADVRLKQGKLDPELMLDSFIVAVCR